MKHKDIVIKYQVVCSLSDPKIIHVSDGYPGGVHDLTIARRSGLVANLARNNEMCIGDKAYQGPRQFVTPYKSYGNRPLSPQQLEHNRILESYRNIVERMNERLKIWQVNAVRWRHPLEKHVKVFQVSAMLTNLILFFHPLNL